MASQIVLFISNGYLSMVDLQNKMPLLDLKFFGLIGFPNCEKMFINEQNQRSEKNWIQYTLKNVCVNLPSTVNKILPLKLHFLVRNFGAIKVKCLKNLNEMKIWRLINGAFKCCVKFFKRVKMRIFVLQYIKTCTLCLNLRVNLHTHLFYTTRNTHRKVSKSNFTV